MAEDECTLYDLRVDVAQSMRHLAGIAADRLRLDADDPFTLASILAQRKGHAADTFELGRDRNGKHGRIMKCDLNTIPA